MCNFVARNSLPITIQNVAVPRVWMATVGLENLPCRSWFVVFFGDHVQVDLKLGEMRWLYHRDTPGARLQMRD